MARTNNSGQPLLMDEVIKVFDKLGHEITYEQAVAALPADCKGKLKEDYFKKLKYKARAGRLAAGSFSKVNTNDKQKRLKPDTKKVKPEELFGDKQNEKPTIPSLKAIFGDGPMNLTIADKDSALNAEVGPDRVKITTTILLQMSDENAKKVFQPTATLAAVTNAKNLIAQMGGNKEDAIKLIQMM